MTSEATVATFIHHIGVLASDHDAGRAYRTAALKPPRTGVGYEVHGVVGYRHPHHDTPSTPRYAARHRPGHRAYRPFDSDPDGNDIEAVHKEVAS
ncbi:hypothetical protein [Streptomyces sp. NPDC026673]|uniref:hypothetical protein n=1 Tax=Streptomyces sp. NPDC026673 TaxID=3155724 RepID=UPI0033E36C64